MVILKNKEDLILKGKHKMKFENFINEENEKIYQVLKECNKFLYDMKSSNALGLFYRKIKDRANKILRKKSHIEDRNPLDTPKYIHNKLNVLFMKKFGWKARNGVFTFGVDELEDDFPINIKGPNCHIFLPVGEYKFVWSDTIKDLYDENDKIETLIKDLSFLDSYKSTNLKEASKSQKEVMFKCDYYYLLPLKYTDNIREVIGSLGD